MPPPDVNIPYSSGGIPAGNAFPGETALKSACHKKTLTKQGFDHV
ncbi:hypothetical protein D083_1030 [Dickeya solani RNS 08.23.3.1.A]|nr:hypothetical protein D083_1030 [Dickeya solani RNS 08.23.3.1.A]